MRTEERRLEHPARPRPREDAYTAAIATRSAWTRMLVWAEMHQGRPSRGNVLRGRVWPLEGES